MFMAKLCVLVVFIFIPQISVNSVFGATIMDPISNSTEVMNSIEKYNSSEAVVSPLPSEKFTPSLAGAFLAGLLGGSVRRPCNNCQCGIVNRNLPYRIVGGQSAFKHEYPWMAQLSYFRRFFCGGTLISERYVLTAGHCADRFFQTWIKVTLGGHNKCEGNSHEWSSYVSRVYSPPLSTMPMFGQDIALLQLADRAPLSRYIRPICLPETKEAHYSVYADRTGTVAGWGTTYEGGRTSCVLRDVNLPILSNTECFEHTNYRNFSDILMTDYMMCAGYTQGGADSCQGDSGGPLMVRRSDGRYEIVGVVSFGIGCARPKYPGIYTRVTKHMSWIRRNTREGCFCRN